MYAPQSISPANDCRQEALPGTGVKNTRKQFHLILEASRSFDWLTFTADRVWQRGRGPSPPVPHDSEGQPKLQKYSLRTDDRTSILAAGFTTNESGSPRRPRSIVLA